MSSTHIEPLITPTRSLERVIRSLIGWLAWGAILIAPPVARIALAVPFLKSGLTKWSGWFIISPTADFLFESMFQLHLFGSTYSFPCPDVLAHFDAVGEVALPLLLIAGLATRFSALGLLLMTGVIQLTVPAGWANFHLPWAALALSIIALGPGPLSVDHAIERWTRRQTASSA
jgi:putative oxidoreductase